MNHIIFKTPENIAHLITNSCIMMVCDCKKAYWHQKLDEASSFLTTFNTEFGRFCYTIMPFSIIFLTTFNTEFGRFCYTIMPFSITVAGDIFQQKLDQCFSHLKNIIVIADDIMVIRKNQKEHDLALTTLLDTTRECNVRSNYDKLQYKKTEVDFFGEMYMMDGGTSWCKPRYPQ